jgi:ABC-type transport system involved in Fe-S cluster assembly fused permease/ATPase subunit
MMNLLHRFLRSRGHITIDGQDLRQVTMDSWYRQIGWFHGRRSYSAGRFSTISLRGRRPSEEVVAASRAPMLTTSS